MQWKGAYGEGFEYQRKHVIIRARQWDYPVYVFGRQTSYILAMQPHGSRDRDYVLITLSLPAENGFELMLLETPDDVKRELDKLGVRGRPHYRKAYAYMQGALAEMK